MSDKHDASAPADDLTPNDSTLLEQEEWPDDSSSDSDDFSREGDRDIEASFSDSEDAAVSDPEPNYMDALLKTVQEAENSTGTRRGGAAVDRDFPKPDGEGAGGDASSHRNVFERIDLPELTPTPADEPGLERLDLLLDVNLRVAVELGRARMTVEDVLKLGQGSVVELHKPAGDPVDVYVNDRLVARGEVLVLNDKFCIRVSEVLAQDPHHVGAP